MLVLFKYWYKQENNQIIFIAKRTIVIFIPHDESQYVPQTHEMSNGASDDIGKM